MITPYEEEQLHKEKLKKQRERDLFLAFFKVESRVKKEADLIDQHLSKNLPIQNLPMVKMLA